MKKHIIITTFILASAVIAAQGQTIPTAGSGAGAFRAGVNDYSTTPTFGVGSAGFDSNTLGWLNSGADSVFMQMIQFDVTGFETDLNDSSNTITLNLSSVNDLAGGTSYSVWLAAQSSVDVQSQGDGGGNGLLATAALPATGTKIADITATGSFDYDVTSLLQGLDFSSDKQLYFRVQVDEPTTNPGGLALGDAPLDGSTLTITTSGGGDGNIGYIKIVPSGSNVNLTFRVQQTTDLGTIPFTDVPSEDITITENAFGEADIDVNVGDPAPAQVFFRIAAGQ
ncbi:MAG: hypothetical protein ACP5I4_06930 [Oceanipulchritudo sp.]